MKRPAVRCRCGHQVLAKEVLRTDLYERPSGREYVYVKYRCKRCKRVGETFIAENRWDWRIFEVPQNEMSESEFEAFAEQNPITSEDLLDFHLLLGKIATSSELASAADAAKTSGIENSGRKSKAEFAADLPLQPTVEIHLAPDLPPTAGDESTPDARAETPAKFPRIEPKRGDFKNSDFKSSNDGLKSNPDPDGKKENKKDIKKDVGKTGGPEDGGAR